MQSGKPKHDRRRSPRWRAWGWLSGWVDDSLKVSIANLGLSGALIENSTLIHPGTTCVLTLALRGEKVRVRCRVARSAIYRWEMWPAGERSCVYRTGLEWVDVPETAQRVIGGYIAFLEREALRYRKRSRLTA